MRITKENYKENIGAVVTDGTALYELIGRTSGGSFIGMNHAGNFMRTPDEISLYDVDDLVGKDVTLDGWADGDFFQIFSRKGLYYFGADSTGDCNHGVWHNWRKV